MEQILNEIISMISYFVQHSNIFFSLFIGFIIIILESIIPILPLSVFIAINVIAFSSIPALFISWIGTTIGCSFSFFLFRKLRLYFYKKMYNNLRIINFINRVDQMKFTNLVMILAMPFTPAFTVNIAAGLSEMKYQKYLLALLSSKIFSVAFWVFVSSTFLDSITDIFVIIKIVLLILGAYILSKVVGNKFNL